jgi:nicotinate-nucleotide adenylyltransferase
MGGTFNPIHVGHLILAESAMHSLKADGMLFVPAHTHPFKESSRLSGFSDRVEMVKLAIRGNDRFLLDDPPESSGYTIDLIDYLRNKYRQADFFLPVGSDIIDEFDSWYKYKDIQRSIKIVVAARPGYRLKTRADGVLGGAEQIIIPQYDISSSEIRKRVRMKMSVRYMVPEGVEKYINETGLYAG